MAISFKRKGKTAPDWYSQGDGFVLGLTKRGTVAVVFAMASKGGGTTEVQVEADKDSFRELAIEMMRADRETAIRAFGEALQWRPGKR